MLEPNQNSPATVPEQPEAKPPLRKSMPVVIALVTILGLIGIANVSSLVSGNKKSVPVSALPMRPATANPQQIYTGARDYPDRNAHDAHTSVAHSTTKETHNATT